MSDFRFANPNWIHAVWLVAGLVMLLLWFDWRRGDVLSRLVSTTMQGRLVQRLSRGRRWLSIGLLGLAGLSLVVALMRPQWGLTYRETPRVGAQIMICLDVSKSMLAEDTAPNRLERAKAELTDLLSYLQGDQVGLIAFAGRAAVLCPLTPDFGFFRLILDGAGPDSVGRGGTRLEEPIRKALDGFRTETDVSRVLVLITDGEDHDSHPLDAAKAAAERGVKILTVGFGDEAGSEIEYTDPQSGARTVVRDADGKPVISRLDGETLRQIAMETEGAYIPAGTGALDLKSIYDAHIAPLVRGRQDGRGHAVRREGFQWAVLCGLIFLIASIAVGGRGVRSEMRLAAEESAEVTRSRAGAAVLLIALLAATPGHAQQPPDESTPPAVTADGVSESPPDAEQEKSDKPDLEGRDPRDMYNDALALLDNDSDRAERLLTEARRESGTDGEVRFRATYNLGWVEVKRAEKVLKEKPEEALEHLRRASDWFRDAVRLRPDHQDARYNLEVVLQRILELADSLAKKDEGDLAQRLDALIGQQRNLVATGRQVVERVAALNDPNAADQFRGDFRQLDVEQRKLLSDSQSLSSTAREELEALEGKSAEEKTPQDNVRAAQLGAVLHYTNRAEQRMGQARSQMRQRQAERAFRRTAAALDELKRARDQLRGPVEVLDVILADAASLAQLTSAKALATRPAVGADAETLQVPTWLTREYLEEGQLSITERVAELAARLQAALDQQGSKPAGPPTPEQQQQNAQADQFLAMVREAMPFLTGGKTAFESAGQTLATEQFDQAGRQQVEGIAALRDARERFLELRGLIELAYAREVQVQGLVAPVRPAAEPQEPKQEEEAKPNEEPVAEAPVEVPVEQQTAALQIAHALQEENIERGQRIAKLIETDLAALPETPPSDAGASDASKNDPAAEQAAAQRQQLELATRFLKLAEEEMTAAKESLAKSTGQGEAKPSGEETAKAGTAVDEASRAASREHVAKAVEHLQSLRRLFFSIVEHLRETAQRQAQLNDETEQAAAIQEKEDLAKKVGPLATRQRELRSIAGEIAKALGEQAQQQPTGAMPEQNVDPQQLAQMQQIQQRFGEAAKLVDQGGTEMETADKNLAFKEPIVDRAREHQDQALEKLVQALALLQPPQQDQQDQQNQQQQDQQQQQQGENKQEQQKDSEMGTDPARLLQAIRDREAERRRDQERRAQMEREPVEKDW
ncbi:MAG: VWA domain-containing protein [Planctomycetaceae bacterium]|nr:VWA domain-containing protein [Planctomycetaceae bacterium]